MINCTTGNQNTAVGETSLSTLTSQVNCTAVGRGALKLTEGNDNTAMGEFAGSTITT